MKVQELMTADPVCCSAQTHLQDIAQQMVECDCGLIPVVDERGQAIGTITDRDIVARAVAQGRNPLELTAQDIMTSPAVTISPEADITDLTHLLEERQLRRCVVTDADGRCVGIVAQADLARASSDEEIAEVLREVSKASGAQASPS